MTVPAATALLLVNPAVWRPAGYVWTEPLSLALTVVALGLGIRLIEAEVRAPWGLMATLGIVLGVGGLLRTAGVLVAAGILVALLVLRRPWWNVLVVGIPAVALPGAWAVVNLIIGGDAAGERMASADGPVAVIARGIATGVTWFTWASSTPGLAVVVIGVMGSLGFLVLLIMGRSVFTLPAAKLVGLTGLVFLALIVAVRIVVAMDDLDSRLLAPLAPVIVILGAMAASSLTNAAGRAIGALVAACMLLSGVGEIARTFSRPQPFAVGVLQESVCQYVHGLTISNASGQLTWACGVPVQGSPRRHAYASSREVDDIPALQNVMSQECVTLVWRTDLEGGHRIPPNELDGFETIATTELATIHRGGVC